MVPSVNSYSKPWGAWSTRRLIDFPLVKRAAAHPISVTGYSRLAICSRSQFISAHNGGVGAAPRGPTVSASCCKTTRTI
jgi:hypothetical protein